MSLAARARDHFSFAPPLSLPLSSPLFPLCAPSQIQSMSSLRKVSSSMHLSPLLALFVPLLLASPNPVALPRETARSARPPPHSSKTKMSITNQPNETDPNAATTSSSPTSRQLPGSLLPIGVRSPIMGVNHQPWFEPTLQMQRVQRDVTALPRTNAKPRNSLEAGKLRGPCRGCWHPGHRHQKSRATAS